LEKEKYAYIPIVSLILIYLLLGVFLFSFKNYPLDDDWSYIKAAETFHYTGKMQFTPWTAMSLVFQIWWGVCFTKLFGFSIEILRLSTLVISLIGLIFIYLLLRELNHEWHTSFLVILLILFNPFSFPLNFTFFTDHFFTSLLFASTFFFHKAFKDKKDTLLLFASLLASAAVLVRQNGILIPLAVLIYLLVSERSVSSLVRKCLLTLLLPLITLILFTYWLNVVHGPPAAYIKQMDLLINGVKKTHLMLIKLVWRPFIILEFVGFCLLPLNFAFLPRLWELSYRKHYSLLLLFCLSGTLFYLLFEHIGLYPSVDLWINGFLFAYISEYGFRGHFNVLFFFYRIADFLSVASIVYALHLLIKGRKSVVERFFYTSPSCVVIMIGIVQLFFFLITPYKFNRYYLTLIPFFILIFLEATRHLKINKIIFSFLLILYSILSIAITQDFMSWNQAKWQAAQRLLDKDIPSKQISAGFAWDAWHNCRYSQQHPYEIAPQKGDIPWWIEELTPVIDPYYLISSSPIPTGFEFFNYYDNDRYTVIDSCDYLSFFYMRNNKIYLLERETRTNEQHTEGTPTFDFLRNFKGMHFSTKNISIEISQVTISIGGITKIAWLQTAPSQVSFRLKLPQGSCRLRAALSMMPSCWDKPGDGALCRILINDILLENIFHITGAIGVEQKRQFFRPKTFFFLPRTYFIDFIDPKHNSDQRKWHEISLDLSTFAGKVVDITFEVTGGPLRDDRYDEILWAHPLIESY